MPTLQVIGCGDAFGSGGRFNACFLVRHAGGAPFLLDCGATSLVAMRRAGVEPNEVATVFVSHLHGDHFGGLPFLLLDARFVSRRTDPLLIAGPPGLRERLRATVENLYPGFGAAPWGFPLEVHELRPDALGSVGGVNLSTFTVEHACGAPPLAFRFALDGRILAYSGDTAWTDALVALGRDADLFVCEATTAEPAAGKVHLDLRTLRERMADIAPRRLLLVHMGPDVLAAPPEPWFERASDGLTVEF